MANVPGGPVSSSAASLDLETDVLILGGGLAGTWAAIAAATGGARTILADKGFCGTSGATAASGTTLWYVDPDPVRRAAAKASREGLGGHLADHGWMDRVLDPTHAAVGQLADWGYPFPRDADGRERRVSVQGPEYMRLMRRRVKQAGVTILDHCPALELLVDGGGAVAGAVGLQRQKGGCWTVRAKAVVIATGGGAFLSKALGCNVLTGDGLLMAAEAGADLSGMIEHIGRARLSDLEALKRLDVLVTTIPTYFLWKGGSAYLEEPDGGDLVVPHAHLLRLGIPTAIATDNIPHDPFFTLWSVCNRLERTSGRVIGPDRRLDAETALRLFTVAGATLTFDEGWKGPLRPGFAADLAVLSEDPTAIDPERLRDLRCRLTVVGGRIVHREGL